jgi:hypothetical protein
MSEGIHAQDPNREKSGAGSCDPTDRTWMDQCWQQMETFMSSEWGPAEHEDRGPMAQAGCCPHTSSHEDQRSEQSMEVSR